MQSKLEECDVVGLLWCIVVCACLFIYLQKFNRKEDNQKF